MFHARQWHADFQSPMFETKAGNIFVNDFILFSDDSLGNTVGKVVKLYTMVSAIHKDEFYILWL